MRWTIPQLAHAIGGRIDPVGAPGAGESYPGRGFGPVGIDSRDMSPGGVFVPIVAGRDGHAFIPEAVARGAGVYLYAHGHRPAPEIPGAVSIAVVDTGNALLDIGRAARCRLDCPVVGITGSVGKTSTKDLAAAAVGAGRRVTASARSFNNELGVPLTLANGVEETEVAIVEMGARGVGHIARLCDVARPTMAVVTAVAAAHTELFGGVEVIARAKGELVEALPAGGTAVLNGDDALVSAMAARTKAAVLRYGVAGSSPGSALDVVAEQVEMDDELRASYILRSPWGSATVVLSVRGAQQVGNSLAALAVALELGVDLDAAVAALGSAPSSPWRMELGTAPGGARILNDAYNANPTSMAAALDGLARLRANRRIAVLGEMAELGPSGPAEHRRIAALAADLAVDLVIVGTSDYGIVPAANIEEALAAVGPLTAGDAVLIKGSRVAGLERLAARLLGHPPQSDHC